MKGLLIGFKPKPPFFATCKNWVTVDAPKTVQKGVRGVCVFSDFHVCCVYVSKMPFSFNGVAHIIMGREASHTCLNVHFSREGIALSVCPIDFSLTIRVMSCIFSIEIFLNLTLLRDYEIEKE